MSKPAVSFIRDCNKLGAFTLPFAWHKPDPSSQNHWHKSKTPSLEAQAIVRWRLLGLGLAIKLSPTCSTPRWMLWFTHNLLTVHHADGRCTWHSDVIVPQCLAFVGFVSCEGDFLLPLPESCPTWLWVTHLCFEDRRVSTGQRHWWTKNSRKVITTGGRSQNWAKFG